MKIMLRFETWATGWFIAHGKKSEAGSRGGRSGGVEVMVEIGGPCYHPGRCAFHLTEFPEVWL